MNLNKTFLGRSKAELERQLAKIASDLEPVIACAASIETWLNQHKTTLYTITHYPCGGESNGYATMYRLQLSAVSTPCSFTLGMVPLRYSKEAKPIFNFFMKNKECDAEETGLFMNLAYLDALDLHNLIVGLYTQFGASTLNEAILAVFE